MFAEVMKRSAISWFGAVLTCFGLLMIHSGPSCRAGDVGGLTMVVMDPLAKPLSCPCVQGYAQRDYHQLADWLAQRLARPVDVVFHESLPAAAKALGGRPIDIVIGKDSVVHFDAQRVDRKFSAVAQLTNKEGGTTITGLIVVPSGDKAQTVADLKGYRIVFGGEESVEKHAAAIALLTQHGVDVPGERETSVACSDGAIAILEGHAKQQAGAAVISSYAQPLLEGCGTVEKGALRVVGETKPVPFITVFLAEELPSGLRESLVESLLASTENRSLREALETRDGFVAISKSPDDKKKE